jgi:hypothetical protein
VKFLKRVDIRILVLTLLASVIGVPPLVMHGLIQSEQEPEKSDSCTYPKAIIVDEDGVSPGKVLDGPYLLPTK